MFRLQVVLLTRTGHQLEPLPSLKSSNHLMPADAEALLRHRWGRRAHLSGFDAMYDACILLYAPFQTRMKENRGSVESQKMKIMGAYCYPQKTPTVL